MADPLAIRPGREVFSVEGDDDDDEDDYDEGKEEEPVAAPTAGHTSKKPADRQYRKYACFVLVFSWNACGITSNIEH